MTTLRSRLAFRHGLMVLACAALMAWLMYFELVQKPPLVRESAEAPVAGGDIAQWFEVGIFIGIPFLFLLSWWMVRKALRPLEELAEGVGRFNAQTLGQRLPRTNRHDEVDRMAASFNSMAARLEQSFQQIREFTLHASHELKTPLTVMRSQLETTLAKDGSITESQRAALENLHEEVIRLGKIVDGLTLLTKADAGMVALERKPVRLDELVQEASEDAEVLAQPDAIRVKLSRCNSASIIGDRDRLRQVLLNLVDNAIKYNDRGGWVEISLQRDGDFAELVVTNTGKGIAPDLLGRVFERFARGEEAQGKAMEGCGLGLTIAKWIVEAHNGFIRIASEPGKTTSVAVRLPIANPTELNGHSP
ncbi:MAG: hypothetical protein RLY20_2408 [Verrucomicrobiota bacterium]|jgi:signal transduction histidine kinase